MFQIDETTAKISTTKNFNPDQLPMNGMELFLKATQENDENKFGTSILKLQYVYNTEPPKWTSNGNNLGTFDEIGIITESRIFAEDDQNTATKIEYNLVDDYNGRYKLSTNGKYVKLELLTLPEEGTTDFLTFDVSNHLQVQALRFLTDVSFAKHFKDIEV